MSTPLDVSIQITLQQGEIKLQGQFTRGYNYTFLVHVHHQGLEHQAVYKPSKGERPLWDFPENSLAKRELAAYLVNRALGWDFVPVTVLREDAPFGPGSLQQFIEYDPNYQYFTFSQEDKQRLRPAALFDLMVNNADRKGSHIIIENDGGRIWLIDHGLCFHAEDKLRTVIWDFAGESIPSKLLSAIERFCADLSGTSDLRHTLEPYLSREEIDALAARAGHLLETVVFPAPPEDRRAFPWPPL